MNERPSHDRRIVWVCLFLVLATVAVYYQVHRFEFINYDDPQYVIENSHVTSGLTREGVRWAFAGVHAANWHPLTTLSHMLDCQIFGVEPGAHHLMNLLLHTINALLLFLLLAKMTGTVWRSAFVAALFALHPLHIESVAWVSERKDVLSTLFWMLTLWAYVAYTERPALQRYLVALLLFSLGLMAKPMLVTLPFVLLLLDYWPLGRWPTEEAGTGTRQPAPYEANVTVAQLVMEKLPFLVFAATSSVVTFLVQRSCKAVMDLEKLPLSARIGNAFVSYVRYIGKMLWPTDLSVLYPHPLRWPLPVVAGAVLLLVCVSVLVVWAARRRRYLLVGWLWYLGTLVPVIGLVQVGGQSIADRYTYIPLIGLFIMVGWGAAELVRAWKYRRIALTASVVIVLTGCMAWTWSQVGYWRDSSTLFRHAIKITPQNVLAHYNLGLALDDRGRLEEAMQHYRVALQLKPDYVAALNNLAMDLVAQGKIEEALAHYSEAIRIDANVPITRNNLGLAFAAAGRLDEAITQYVAALRINPGYERAHYNLGVALTAQGKTEQAIQHYREALRLKPGWPRAANKLAWILATHPDPKFRDGQKAIQLASKACELTGNQQPDMMDTLAAAYAEAGQFDKAIATAQKAAELASTANQEPLLEVIQSHLQLYRAGRPYHEVQSP